MSPSTLKGRARPPAASADLREQMLLELAKRDTTDLRATYRAATEAACVLVEVARASVWRLTRGQLICDDLFLADEVRHTSGQTIDASCCPAYFASVRKSLVLSAEDAHTDQRTKELEADYLGPLGIGALLDTPIWVDGAVAGVLCCEHVGGPHPWTARQERDAAKLADLVARSIEAAARRTAEERWRVIVEAIPAAVAVVDAGGAYVQANSLARRALAEEGGTRLEDAREALEIRDLGGCLVPHDQWPTDRARRGDVVRGEIVQISSKITGKKRWFRVTSAPVSIGGAIEGAVSVYEDVADEIRLESVKRDFVSILAHELRTPTSIVKGYAQRLSRIPSLAAEGAPALDAMLRAAERMGRLADELVDLSAIMLGRMVTSPEHVDLRDLAGRAIDRAAAARTHEVRFAKGDVPVPVFADPSRIERVIGELIENAGRYSVLGSEIRVDVQLDADAGLVTVEDHGIGIPRLAQPHVFDPFFRAHAGTSFDVGGLGIGLFIGREIVRHHRGSMWFRSRERVGTTFGLRLPLE